jgi:putative hydrolase of the HAD superfamily
MKQAVLFDLGNTLVRYYSRDQWPDVIREAMAEVRAWLDQEGLLHVSEAAIWRAVEAEDHEAADHRVRPLEGRLRRIFQLCASLAHPGLELDLARAFLRPIFGRAHRYPDALPTLEALRTRGLALAILSNTPWGSPAAPWRDELVRLGLLEAVDLALFCRDVGWRKPARPIFDQALQRLGLPPQACLFVGDHPVWDVAGPQRAGIDALLIDRRLAPDPAAAASLWDVIGRLEQHA